MLTRSQIKNLAQYYQIDEFTIFREYLQLLFLSYLYRQPKSSQIYFKGGTAIRLLLNSPRFSEDLDFSTPDSKKQIQAMIKTIKKELTKELPEITISIQYQGKKSIRFRLKYKSPDFKYPFVIRLDFTEKEKIKKVLTSPLVTRYPFIFPVITHHSAEEILAEKMRAFLTRSQGRDIFDLWFLLAKGTAINQSLIEQKLKEKGKNFSQEKLIQKIESFPMKKLKLDLGQFLPRPQKKIIENLKEELIKELKR